jgi:hypothetical protein
MSLKVLAHTTYQRHGHLPLSVRLRSGRRSGSGSGSGSGGITSASASGGTSASDSFDGALCFIFCPSSSFFFASLRMLW